MSSIQEKITATIDKLTALISQSDPQELAYKATPDFWSILECAEHIHLVNSGIAKLLQKPGPETNENMVSELFGESKMNHLLVTKRAAKQVAPESVTPKGIFKTAEEATKAIHKDIHVILHLLNTKDFSQETFIIHHPRLGNMTKTDWLYFLIAHTERHFFQIEEMKRNFRNSVL
jgi:uncharacterized damage-inducible protein DinB